MLASPAPTIRSISSNRVGRDFVVGDIHGCMSALRALLRKVSFHTARDRLFSVGDLVDRGPASIQALELLREPWFFAVRGNHEQMLIDHLRRPDANKAHDSRWLRGAYSSFTERQQFASYWLPKLDRLPLVLSVGMEDTDPSRQFYVVHAEILEDKAYVTQEMISSWSFERPGKARQRAIWGRSLISAWWEGRPVERAHVSNLPIIVCGHTMLDHPYQIARQAFIDRGAYLAYDMSALDKVRQAYPTMKPGLCLFEPATASCWTLDSRNGDNLEEMLLNGNEKSFSRHQRDRSRLSDIAGNPIRSARR